MSLLDDAILLFENQRYERAIAIAILAIEESGKPMILLRILLEDNPKELKKEWQNYRKHTEKNKNWVIPQLISEGANHIDEMGIIVTRDSEHRFILENLKQLAFYTDSFTDCKWSTPKNAITKELAEKILNTAKILVIKGDSMTMTTKEELNLWIKHIKPVWKKDMLKMKKALINCYKECEDLGLVEKGTTKNMTDFVL